MLVCVVFLQVVCVYIEHVRTCVCVYIYFFIVYGIVVGGTLKNEMESSMMKQF